MKYSNVIGILILLFTIAFSCEKDDICAEETPTTPHLVIRFYDLASPDDTSVVPSLLAYGLDDMNTIVPFVNEAVASRDSIAIPLRTDVNSTRFVLHNDYEVDEDDMVLGNPDIITVNYEREDVYVSRACGFKTIFNNITFSVDSDGDNWIINSEIVNTTIDNQNAAHVKVFH